MNESVDIDICVYHGGCSDGFGAAFAVWCKYGDEECYYLPAVYQQDPPGGFEQFRDKDVVFVDFCYPKDVMEKIADLASTLLIIDHHKTAAATISDMASRPDVGCSFNLEKSGAVLAWEYFHPEEKVPRLLQHIQDRDLWRFALDHTREISAALYSYPFDFDLWNKLVHRCEKNSMELVDEGKPIIRAQMKHIADFLTYTSHLIVIGGYEVPAVTVPFMWASEAGNILCKGSPFSACYYKNKDGWKFSLRSTDEGVDVSEVAQQYGGGGHRNAAGFTVADLSRL